MVGSYHSVYRHDLLPLHTGQMTVHRKVRLEPLWLSQPPRGELLLYRIPVRMEPRPHSFHQEEVLGLGKGDQLIQLGEVESEGFLAQDVLACVQGVPSILKVIIVWSTYVDGVDILLLSRALE